MTEIGFCQLNAGDNLLLLTEFFNNCCQTQKVGRAFMLTKHNSSEANGLIVQYHEVLKALKIVVILQKHIVQFLKLFSVDSNKLCYNPGHNIMELYNILVQIQFATSKTKLDN